MEGPQYYRAPSPELSGMSFYTGDRFPDWRGDLFVGGLWGRSCYRNCIPWMTETTIASTVRPRHMRAPMVWSTRSGLSGSSHTDDA